MQAYHARSEVSLDPSAWVGLGMQANEVSFDPSLCGREPIADDDDDDDEEEEEEEDDMEKGGEGRKARGGSVVYVYTHACVHVYTHARVHAYTRACTYAHHIHPLQMKMTMMMKMRKRWTALIVGLFSRSLL